MSAAENALPSSLDQAEKGVTSGGLPTGNLLPLCLLARFPQEKPPFLWLQVF